MRARSIKPSFFQNEDLSELSAETRLLFIGLWCIADREGRLEDRPKRIKIQVFPCDSVEVDLLLQDLEDREFILRYKTCGRSYIQVINFLKHQSPHYREAASTILPPDGWQDSEYPGGSIPAETRRAVMARDKETCQACGAHDDLTLDHLTPQSKGGQHTEDNLQVLCRPCNSAKNNRLAASHHRPTVGLSSAKQSGRAEAAPDDEIVDNSVDNSPASHHRPTVGLSSAKQSGPLASDSGLLTPDSGLLTADSGLLTPDSGLLTPDERAEAAPDDEIVDNSVDNSPRPDNELVDNLLSIAVTISSKKAQWTPSRADRRTLAALTERFPPEQLRAEILKFKAYAAQRDYTAFGRTFASWMGRVEPVGLPPPKGAARNTRIQHALLALRSGQDEAAAQAFCLADEWEEIGRMTGSVEARGGVP